MATDGVAVVGNFQKRAGDVEGRGEEWTLGETFRRGD